MATAIATATTIVGLGTSSLSPPSRISSPCLSSAFLKFPLDSQESSKASTGFRRKVYMDFNVIGFGLIGWLAPSSIPAINGNSLTGLFFQSIGTELAHFPTGPPLTSPFWLWLVTWHFGLFVCLTFGQIGFKGRTEEYF